MKYIKEKINPTTIRMTEAEKADAEEFLLKNPWLKGFSALIRYALQQLYKGTK